MVAQVTVNHSLWHGGSNPSLPRGVSMTSQAIKETLSIKEGNYKTLLINGFVCDILRHSNLLHLCGYVYLPPEHPFYKKNYEEIDVSVHGGLTFSTEYWGWWKIGFDCAHYGDLSPIMAAYDNIILKDIDYDEIMLELVKDNYRSMDFVEQELNKLTKQCADVYDTSGREVINKALEVKLLLTCDE